MKRYEQAIRVITAFFAFLLGFGLKRLLDQDAFDPPNARWPCFLLSVFLFLRLLLGSGNHMWYEFIRPDLAQDSKFKGHRLQLLGDFLFLVLFGLIGVSICYTNDLRHFLKLNIVLTSIGLVWVVVYQMVSFVRTRLGKSSVPQGEWGYWGWINLIQLLSVVGVFYFTPNRFGAVPESLWIFAGPAWDLTLVILVVIYLGLFIYDFFKQLGILQASRLVDSSNSDPGVAKA